MDKIVLNNGFEIPDGVISQDGSKRVLVIIPGEDIVQAALLFGDSEKTKVMVFYTSVYKYIYTGYDTINSMSVDSDRHKTLIYLSGENTHVEREYTVPEIYLPEEMRTNSSEEVNENA